MKLVTIVFISACFAAACGKDSKQRHQVPEPEPKDRPEKEDPESFNLVEREAEVVKRYRDIGVEFIFWAYQEEEKRDVEIKQLLELLPEIETRSSYIKTLEISGQTLNLYDVKPQRLRISLTNGVLSAIEYLKAFDEIRRYEQKLGGTLLERAGETKEILDADLKFYKKVKLAELIKGRDYIAVIHPSGSMQFIQSRRILYIKSDATAKELEAKLDAIGRWHDLSQELGLEIVDKTEDGLYGTFDSAVESLWKTFDSMKLVADLIKRIEITKGFSRMTFDLGTGVFKMSRLDAEESGSLWLALAKYKQISVELDVPVEIPQALQKRSELLGQGFSLILDNLEAVQSKLGSIDGIRMSLGEETRLNSERILWVGSEQDSDQFRSFVEAI